MRTRRQFLITAGTAVPAFACVRGRPPAVGPGGVLAPTLDDLMAKLTLDEKIGQMTQADNSSLRKRPQDVRDLMLGSVLCGGDSLPNPNTLDNWVAMYDGYQQQALGTRLAIPIVFGVDSVHGHNGLAGAVIFPHNIGLGCTRNAALVEKVARTTAIETAATGIDWTFAPCIAVARNERWGRTYEAFGETPELAGELGAAAVRGYQTDNLGNETAVLACAKHYVGDGGTIDGKDQGDTAVSEEELRRLHLAPYPASISAGAGSIMVSFSSVNGEPMHAHRRLITDVLKHELGFQGFVISDFDGFRKVPGDFRAQITAGVNAGIDMFMISSKYAEFIATLRTAVQSGEVPMDRIDDAVRRILRQKLALRLWERPYTDRQLGKLVGSPAHREVGRQAVRESVVLLKNDRQALPLAKTARRIHVVGSRADDIGVQCGGWALSWQGKRGLITAGTTILQAIKQAAPGAQVTFSPDGSGAAGADVVVAVVGENPYAEGKGDLQDLTLAADEQAIVTRAKEAGRPLIVVLLSGRPLLIDGVLAQADAVLAAWLPGTEGQGVADVLFGDHKPTGKLSISWPRTMAQIPINAGDASYDPLFAFGYGLGY